MIDSLSNNIDFAKQYEVCFDDLGMYFTSKTNRPEHYFLWEMASMLYPVQVHLQHRIT